MRFMAKNRTINYFRQILAQHNDKQNSAKIYLFVTIQPSTHVFGLRQKKACMFMQTTRLTEIYSETFTVKPGTVHELCSR